MAIQKTFPMKPIAKGILIGILCLLAVGTAFVFVAPMAMEQIAFSEQKRIFDNSAESQGISDNDRMKIYMSVPQHENPLVTPEDNYRIYNAQDSAKIRIAQQNCENLQSHIDWYKDAIQNPKPNWSVSYNIVTPEILDVYEKALSECLSIGEKK